MALYRVTGSAVKVRMGKAGEKAVQARIVIRGGLLPDGVADESIAGLLDLGMIEEVVVEDTDEAAQTAGDDPGQQEAGQKAADPKPEPTPAPTPATEQAAVDLVAMDLDALKAFAAEKGIELGNATTADRVRKVIAAALAEA